jgi:hypothetical protein
MNKEQAKDKLIKVLESQVIDLTMMSKIELGDDVIAEIGKLKDIIAISDWDVTLMDGLENEPPYVSDDFQIGPNGAYEHTEELYKTKNTSKVTIEFDRVEEAEELRTALDGHKYKSVIWELDQKLRSVCKYGTAIEGNKEAIEEVINTCENLRDVIRELLQEYNLPIE